MGCSEVWSVSNFRCSSRYEWEGVTYSNQILVCLVTSDLVQFLIELGELSSLCHLVPKHELRRLQRGVVPLGQELETVVDAGPVKS